MQKQLAKSKEEQAASKTAGFFDPSSGNATTRSPAVQSEPSSPKVSQPPGNMAPIQPAKPVQQQMPQPVQHQMPQPVQQPPAPAPTNQAIPRPQSGPTTPFVPGAGSYGSGVRAQVFEVIVRQALAGAPWREICAGPMQVNNITAEEVEAEVKRRQALLGKK